VSMVNSCKSDFSITICHLYKLWKKRL